MLMTPAEINLIEVAKRYTAISIQVSKAYEAETAKMNLDAVLSYAQLSSSDGTLESIEVIDRLAALTDAHKAAVEKVFVACANELTKALAELPEAQGEEYRDGLLKSLHGQLAAQSEYYENRGKWIEAAREVCKLLESQREGARFVGETIVFEEDADNGRFESLMADIEEIHAVEAAHTKKILDCFKRSVALMGTNPQ
jgi:hypothetical protein